MNFILVSRYLPERFNWLYFGIVILVGYLAVELIRPLIKNKMKKMSYPCLSYLYIVFALIINITIAFVATHNIMFLLMLFGGLCFFASDVILTIYTFVKKIKKGKKISEAEKVAHIPSTVTSVVNIEPQKSVQQPKAENLKYLVIVNSVIAFFSFLGVLALIILEIL